MKARFVYIPTSKFQIAHEKNVIQCWKLAFSKEIPQSEQNSKSCLFKREVKKEKK